MTSLSVLNWSPLLTYPGCLNLPAETVPAALPPSHHPAYVGSGADASLPLWPDDTRQTNQHDDTLESHDQSRLFTFAANSFFALLYSSTALCRRERRPSNLYRQTRAKSELTGNKHAAARCGQADSSRYLFSVTRSDVVVGQFLMIVILIIQILQSFMLLQLTELTHKRQTRAQAEEEEE